MHINSLKIAKMFPVTILLPLFFLSIFGYSTEYYVKNGGNDNNTGLSDAQAWATLSKIQTTLTGDQSDNAVYLKCGSTWREQLRIEGNGTSGHPFTLGQYGTGNDPKIMGSEQVTGWTVYSGNVWQATCPANDIPDPGDFSGPIWFINAGDGKTYWGKPESALIDVDKEYDWYWESDVLYCYATTDPDSRYTSVEAAMRRNCIATGWAHDYVYIRDIEMCFSARPSLCDNYHTDYWTVDGCYIHHSGTTTGGHGDNIKFEGDGWVIKNNLLHDGPAHNMQYYGYEDVSSILIENNTCYNSGHASIDCKHVGGVGVTSNVTIRYNLLYMTSDYAWPDKTNASISVQSNQASRMVGVDIYENIIVDVWKNGIFIYTYVEDVNIYNNSVYGEHALSSFDGRLINISGGNTTNKPVNVTIKNNIMAGALDAAGYGLFIKYDGSVTACDYNCFYITTGHYSRVPGTTYEAADWDAWKTDTGFDIHSVWNTNPDFVNPGTHTDTDYQIQYYSPCKNAGTDVGLSTDYFGNAIPYGLVPDIGAHENNDDTAPLNVNINASPTSGQAPLLVNFTSSVSGGISPYSYSWTFGDGGTSTAQNPSHTYSSAGNYTATLTVTGNNSENASDTESITVSSSTAAILSIAAATGAPAPGPGGTTNPSPGIYSYSIGSTVSINSIPNTDYRFSMWTGDVATSSMFNPTTALTMNSDKSISANFCSKCGDVNGDLQISPGDAQSAFEIYLQKKANPTECELENADVNGSGTQMIPEVTPADAQMIFNKYLNRGTLSSDCSGASRSASLSTQTMGFSDVSLTINDITVSSGQDIFIPIIIESPSEITAFGFDLEFPSNVLTFMGLERTGLTENYDQLDANVLSDQVMNHKILRVGGYNTNNTQIPSSGVLVTLVFRLTGELENPISLSIKTTYDDIKNATVQHGINYRQNNSLILEDKRRNKNIKKTP